MSSWWETLSLREKTLIGCAGAMLALIVVWYGIISPLLTARGDARSAHGQAAENLAQLERLAAADRARTPAATGIAVSTGANLNADAFKAEVTRAAQSSGLSISRLQGGQQGRFSLVFEQADPRLLFYWINEVESRLGGEVSRLSVDQTGEGRVRATIEVESGGR